MSRYSGEKSFATGDWFGAIKRNPEGLLLLAAGCALLMRTGSSRATESLGRRGGPLGQQETQPEPEGRAKDWGVHEGLSEARHTAGQYASDLTRQVTETASSYASSAARYADQARHAVSERSGDFAYRARSTLQETLDRVVQERPLAVAVLGFAAGAAVAAAFPATATEKRTLGLAGERLADAAEKAGEQLKEASAKAGERLVSVAEERGLSADGVKEMARDVAREFGRAFSGNKSPQEPSGAEPSGLSVGATSPGHIGQAGDESAGPGKPERSGTPQSTGQSQSDFSTTGSNGRPQNPRDPTRKRDDR